MKCGRAALWACALGAAGALQVVPPKGQANAAPASNATSEVLAVALEAAQSLIGAHSRHPAASNASAPHGARAKIDLGLTEFEKSLEEKLAAGCHNATQGDAAWTPELQQQLVQNVTGVFGAGLKKALAPIKQSIGKTWMALPEDEQKDGYVLKLRTGFAPTLDANVEKMAKHLQLGLSRVRRLSQKKEKLSSDELLHRSEQIFNDNLLAEHCYADDTSPKAKKKLTHFCIASVVGSMVRNLNDTTSLVSMTMRFDANAMMSLVQEPNIA